MPFTPFHFGLCLPIALGDVKYKRIDITSSLLGSIKQTTSLKNKIFWCLLMANIHVLFDAMIYPEMIPLIFILENPFFGLLNTSVIYSICIFGAVIGLLEYILSIKIKK